MNTRTNGFQILYNPQQREWKETSCCPICGKPKTEWKRRTDWTCCSLKCSEEHQKLNIKYWPDVRRKIIKRDNFTCKHCGYTPTKGYEYKGEHHLYPESGYYGCFRVDHIKPLAIGGEEWNESNMQTLCPKCDKIKTAKDMADIAKQRIKDQLLAAGQKLFGDED
jgi:5-methylcytosine-specific restriction endonuclease McrA